MGRGYYFVCHLFELVVAVLSLRISRSRLWMFVFPCILSLNGQMTRCHSIASHHHNHTPYQVKSIDLSFWMVIGRIVNYTA